MHPEDQELAERARLGDDGAFDTLCRRHEAAVRQYLYGRLPARLRKRMSAGDVVQEALTTALQRLRTLEVPFHGSFRAWLLKIAEYKAKEATRFHLHTAKRAAHAELSSPNRPITEALRVASGSPSLRAAGAESRALMDDHLAALKDSYRVILELVYASGLPIAEAARRMEITPDAARKLHARAIAALAKRVKAANEEGHGSL